MAGHRRPGVTHPRSGFGSDGSFVRALEDVRAGEQGKFEEVP
jgi:hypothetical protein